jgi:ribosomal protein S27AE
VADKRKILEDRARCPKCGTRIPLFRISGRIECGGCGAPLVASDMLAMIVVLVLWSLATPLDIAIVSAISSGNDELFMPLFIVSDLLLGFLIFYLVYRKSGVLNIREERRTE